MKGIRRRLRQQRQERLKSIRIGLLDPESLDQVRRDLEWIALIDRSDKARSRARFTTVVLPILVVLVGLGLLLLSIMRLPDVDFVVEVEASSVEFRLSEPWALPRRIAVSSLVLEGMEDVHLRGSIFSNVGTEAKPAVSAELQEGEATVRDLEVALGARVTLANGPTGLVLAVADGRISGEVGVAHGTLIVRNALGSKEQEDVWTPENRPPEKLVFESAASSKRASRVHLIGAWSLEASSMDLGDVQFLEDARTAPERFRSTILGGTLRVLNTNSTTELSEDDCLDLSGLECRRARVWCAKAGSVHLLLEGSAATLQAGPRDHMRNLRPTWLEYLYYGQPLWVKVLSLLIVVPSLVVALRQLFLTGGV